jgi:hypothetical protein
MFTRPNDGRLEQYPKEITGTWNKLFYRDPEKGEFIPRKYNP